MPNIQVQTALVATTLWRLRKSETDIVCAFDARGSVFELAGSGAGVLRIMLPPVR